jgi:glutathione S-transferase
MMTGSFSFYFFGSGNWTKKMDCEGALAKRAYLIADHFTVADFNVACVLSPSRAAHLDLRAFSRVDQWLRRCYERPAAIATRTRFAA